MNKSQIWKVVLDLRLSAPLTRMPKGAQILSVAVQREQICVWAKVDTSAPMVERQIGVYGTGMPLPEDTGVFVGTFLLADGSLVLHVFDHGETEN